MESGSNATPETKRKSANVRGSDPEAKVRRCSVLFGPRDVEAIAAQMDQRIRDENRVVLDINNNVTYAPRIRRGIPWPPEGHYSGQYH